MSVALFGSGLTNVFTTEISGPDGAAKAVSYTVRSDQRIDFVMPAGPVGTSVSVTVHTADESSTLPNAFTYEAETVAVVDGLTGGVITTTSGMTLVVPPLGIAGPVVITLTPSLPPTNVNGSLLLYSFYLNISVNGQPILDGTNFVVIDLDVSGSDGDVNEKPLMFESAANGGWMLVPVQSYSPDTQHLVVRVVRSTNYVVSMTRATRIMIPLVRTWPWPDFPKRRQE